MPSDKYIIANFWRNNEPHKKTSGKLHMVTADDGSKKSMASIIHPLSQKHESEFLVNIEIIGKPEDRYHIKEFVVWALRADQPDGIASSDKELIGEWLDFGNVSPIEEPTVETKGKLHLIDGELSSGAQGGVLYKSVVDGNKAVIASELRKLLSPTEVIVNAIPVEDFTGNHMGARTASMLSGHLRHLSLRAQVFHDALLAAIEEAEAV